jgi:hypothetical protein
MQSRVLWRSLARLPPARLFFRREGPAIGFAIRHRDNRQRQTCLRVPNTLLE